MKNKNTKMLKKLDFFFRPRNFSTHSLQLEDFLSLINDIFDNPYLYKFKLDDNIYIHIIDFDGNVLYSDCLFLKNDYWFYGLDFIYGSFYKLDNWVKSYPSDKTRIIYFSTKETFAVDIDYIYNTYSEAIKELKKMFRDLDM